MDLRGMGTSLQYIYDIYAARSTATPSSNPKVQPPKPGVWSLPTCEFTSYKASKAWYVHVFFLTAVCALAPPEAKFFKGLASSGALDLVAVAPRRNRRFPGRPLVNGIGWICN